MKCKYCGKEIPKSEVWNPDENGNGYHHRCLIDIEFDENETYIKNLKNRSIIIPDNATNGDVIKALFPQWDLREEFGYEYKLFGETHKFEGLVDENWWNEQYKKEVEE